MFWIIKKKILGILGKIFFLGLYTLIIIFFEGSLFENYLKEYLKVEFLKTASVRNQLVVFIGLFFYSIIIELISNSKIMICPKINYKINLNKHQKIVSCNFSSLETANNSKKIFVSLEKNFETIIGKFVFFLKKYYQFVLEIKYPSEIGLDFDPNFLNPTEGFICREIKKEKWQELINGNYKYIHIKGRNAYYINIFDIGDNDDYENEYFFYILPKGVLKYSKIKSNLTFHRKKISQFSYPIISLFFPIIWIFFILIINFTPINIGVVVEEVN